MQSRLIDVAGGRASVRVFEGGDGAPLLYLHGAGGLFKDDPFIQALSKHYRVYAPLLPGYGDSEGADRLRDMLDVTLHCYDVMDALNLSKPLVMGHSMGGMIAAEMAAVAPNEIERLCLLCPAGLWLDEKPIPDLFATLPSEFPPLLFHDVEFGTKLMTAGADMNNLDFLVEFLIMNGKRFGMAGKLLFPIPDRGLSDRIHRIKARTLLIWGKQDRLIDVAYGKAFKEKIADARLEVIDGGGHLVNYEKPEAVIEAMAKLN